MILYYLFQISCIPLLIPPSEEAYIILHILAGISSAGLSIVIPVYIREISDVKCRGAMMSLMVVLTAAGFLMRLVLDADDRLYLIAVMVIVQFISLFMTVESPAYLVKVGKLEVSR